MASDDPRASPGLEETKFKVFVGGLLPEIDSKQLKQAFDEFEPIEADVRYDKHTEKSRLFGFVTFPTKQLMEDAIQKMNGATLDG